MPLFNHDKWFMSNKLLKKNLYTAEKKFDAKNVKMKEVNMFDMDKTNVYVRTYYS